MWNALDFASVQVFGSLNFPAKTYPEKLFEGSFQNKQAGKDTAPSSSYVGASFVEYLVGEVFEPRTPATQDTLYGKTKRELVRHENVRMLVDRPELGRHNSQSFDGGYLDGPKISHRNIC